MKKLIWLPLAISFGLSCAIVATQLALAQTGSTVIQVDPNARPDKIFCPTTIKVRIDDSTTGQDWPTSPVDATYLRVEISNVRPPDRPILICTYGAWGGEFKIRKLLDKPYRTCDLLARQGDSGGVSCTR